MNGCYGCGRDMEPVVVRPGEAPPTMPTILVYPSVSKGDIVFCDLCFEEGRFRDLTREDVQTITWFVGSALVDQRPERAVELLEPMLSKWRAPDILSPLGRAYLGVGRATEGKALLREALSLSPEHPYAERDRLLLEDEGA